MFGLDDVIRKHPLAAVGLAAVAITAAKPARSKRDKGRAGVDGRVKTVIKFCLEAQADAETDIIEGLADVAINDVCRAVACAEPETRHEAAKAAVHSFTRRAQRRAVRHARDESDRKLRYARHTSALEKRILDRHAAAPEEHKRTFEHALSALQDRADAGLEGSIA